MTAPFDLGSPPDVRTAKKYFGKYAAIALDNAKPADSAHRGDLLVEVPGILEEDPSGTGDRALQVTAKPSFLPGFFFIPENQDPVWVEFVAGGMTLPCSAGVRRPGAASPPPGARYAASAGQKVGSAAASAPSARHETGRRG